MIVTFQIEIEIDEMPEDGTDVMEFKDEMNRIKADMEEVVGRHNFSLYNADWETDN